MVEPVAIRPMRSVTAASADSSVNGSNEVTVWLRLSAFDRHVQHGQVVGHEEGVELAGLELLDEALQMAEVEIGVRPGAGIAPGAGVDADRAHEGAELQLPLCHRPVSVLGVVREDIGTRGNSAIGEAGRFFCFLIGSQHVRVIPGRRAER